VWDSDEHGLSFLFFFIKYKMRTKKASKNERSWMKIAGRIDLRSGISFITLYNVPLGLVVKLFIRNMYIGTYLL
jgi:hypothetical protein